MCQLNLFDVAGDLFGTAAHKRLERLQRVLDELLVIALAIVNDERNDVRHVLADTMASLAT